MSSFFFCLSVQMHIIHLTPLPKKALLNVKILVIKIFFSGKLCLVV